MAKVNNRKVSVKMVEEFRQQLRQVAKIQPPPPQANKLSKLQVVQELDAEIRGLIANGYTLRQIVEVLKVQGLEISLTTLKRANLQQGGSRRKSAPQSKPEGGANTSTTVIQQIAKTIQGPEKHQPARAAGVIQDAAVAMKQREATTEETAPRSRFKVRPDRAEL